MLQTFCDWLSQTPFSLTIQTIVWIIPMVQSIHILAIAAVISSIAVLDLRLLGLMGRTQTVPDLARRFMPWIWIALIVLTVSGSLLIIGEPARSLINPMFRLKMVLLVAAIGVTLLFQETIRRNIDFWELSPARRNLARIVATVSLLVWTAIIIAGRWIAYAEF